jgi:hypothetical protein
MRGENISPGKPEREISIKLVQRALCSVCVQINLTEWWYAFNPGVELLFMNYRMDFRLLLAWWGETIPLSTGLYISLSRGLNH